MTDYWHLVRSTKNNTNVGRIGMYFNIYIQIKYQLQTKHSSYDHRWIWGGAKGGFCPLVSCFSPLELMKQRLEIIQSVYIRKGYMKDEIYSCTLHYIVWKKLAVNGSNFLSRSKHFNRAVTTLIKQSLHLADYYNTTASSVWFLNLSPSPVTPRSAYGYGHAIVHTAKLPEWELICLHI